MPAEAVKVTQVFEVEDPPANPLSTIPDVVRRHFQKNTGDDVTLASAHPYAMTQLHGTGRVPIHYKELPDDIVAMLRRQGFVVHAEDGTVRKMDCCLYRQAANEKAHWRSQRLAEQQRREMSSATIEEAYEETRREVEGRRSGRRVMKDLYVDQKPADSHVRFDPAMAPTEE